MKLVIGREDAKKLYGSLSDFLVFTENSEIIIDLNGLHIQTREDILSPASMNVAVERPPEFIEPALVKLPEIHRIADEILKELDKFEPCNCHALIINDMIAPYIAMYRGNLSHLQIFMNYVIKCMYAISPILEKDDIFFRYTVPIGDEGPIDCQMIFKHHHDAEKPAVVSVKDGRLQEISEQIYKKIVECTNNRSSYEVPEVCFSITSILDEEIKKYANDRFATNMANDLWKICAIVKAMDAKIKYTSYQITNLPANDFKTEITFIARFE